jgi:uncharacterized membrane protein YGL010W
MQSHALQSQFRDYASVHTTHGNKVCHAVGIPLIVVTTFGLLSHWIWAAPDPDALLRLDGAIALMAAATAFYLRLDWRLAASFLPVQLACYFLGRALPWPVLWTLFVLGWIIQYVGHYAYEKKSPSFYRNLAHIFIGPLWLFARAIGRGTA